MKTYEILKSHCRYIYYGGCGNFWYEEGFLGDDSSIAYRIFQIILFFMYLLMTFLEIMAAVGGNFPEDERSDAVTFAWAHTMVLTKIFSVMANKKLIKALNKKMVKICKEYETEAQNVEKYKIIKINILAYCVNVYGAMLCYIFEGFRKMREGRHFVTVVTYYPSSVDDSVAAIGFRIFTTIDLIVMLITMIVAAHGLTMVYLIMFKYKIITLRHYLEDLRKEFDRASPINVQLASENLTSGLINGIVMHGELIRMFSDIDKAFGTVMTLQVGLCTGSAVSLLLQIALSKNITFFATMKILFFLMSLYFLLALFLCNAGEITYQASLLSDAIFYIGWHACVPQRRVGLIVAFSVAQAQRPLVMKAFNMLELTYGTFLSVVRSTYSVFALFYAQNK